jgi:hypothetical protein
MSQIRFCPTCKQEIINKEDKAWRHFVNQTRKTIQERGRIWEGGRLSFENGSYDDPELARLLREGIIVPHPDPSKGYILPGMEALAPK